MRRRPMKAMLLCLAAVAILALAATPAQAVVGGTPDTTNIYDNVGMIWWHHDGVWDLGGSCTLVRNGAGGVIVVTAAHCVVGVDLKDFRVVFDPMSVYAAEFGARPVPDTETWPIAYYYEVADVAVHPDYPAALDATKYGGNAKGLEIGPGREDVALLWLEGPVYMPDAPPLPPDPLADVAPAEIVGLNGLNVPDLTSRAFVFVGYGVNDFPFGSAMSWQNPNFLYTWTGRRSREVSVVSEHGAFADRYLMHTVSSSFGDSGGPLFDSAGTIVALCVRADNRRCVSPDYDYRLDTYAAQGFLSDYDLVPAPPLK